MAVSEIGGLPRVDVGEDIMLSALLHNAGWQIAVVEDELQHGVAPATYASYIKQRMRWVGLNRDVEGRTTCVLADLHKD